MANTFSAVLLNTLELQFISSSSLSNLQYTRQHARKIIALNKEFDISPGQYRLDSLSPLIFSTKEVDEVTRRYFRLPLEQVDHFHRTQIEHEIARLDIITAWAANRLFALKNILNSIQSHKAKRWEELEIIVAIKNNNLQSEVTILVKKQN